MPIAGAVRQPTPRLGAVGMGSVYGRGGLNGNQGFCDQDQNEEFVAVEFSRTALEPEVSTGNCKDGLQFTDAMIQQLEQRLSVGIVGVITLDVFLGVHDQEATSRVADVTLGRRNFRVSGTAACKP
ncbi:hypothetical protein NE237_029367 [Protea cynaroides]|uniref:Uncharacterized protein n=1 Tax=Protea cynaroides TaxID=273540 RepID=A0A9Q0JW03_9MAGN|nr:hypothetical protein NE237_029367 [Protea cynaroides]